MLWLMGNGSKWGAVVGFIGQLGWIFYTVKTGQFGLLPGVALYTIIHARNVVKMSHTGSSR
jgi:hypothetical protein